MSGNFDWLELVSSLILVSVKVFWKFFEGSYSTLYLSAYNLYSQARSSVPWSARPPQHDYAEYKVESISGVVDLRFTSTFNILLFKADTRRCGSVYLGVVIPRVCKFLKYIRDV